MPDVEQISEFPDTDRPRHAHREVADLLATALLRLRARSDGQSAVDLGFPSQERVNANPDHHHGVRP
jgi:hypothetical protein